MRRGLRAKLLASALVLSAVPLMAATIPAQAQYYAGIGFDSFHDQLEQYGYWLYSDRWGLVWQPADVSYEFQPYFTGGHWVYTDDYGWYWASEYPWGDIAFHYGRWVNDPDDGWLWIPGYTWSPGWVVWRTNGEFVGWMPAPPDRAFLEGRGDVNFGVSFGLGGGGISFNWNDPYYGYRSWYGSYFDERRFARNWVFVGLGHMADRDYRPFVVRDPVRVVGIIRNTRNITNYTVVNNFVVNRSIDVHMVERAAGRRIEVAPARMVIRQPNLVTRVDVGRQVMMRERMTAPRGTGFANSAPPPPASVVNKLSVQVAPRNGRQPMHLFTRSTVTNPEAQTRFRGPMPGRGPQEGGPGGMGPSGQGPGERGQPGGMNGPGGQGGMGGPGNEQQPSGEMRHHEQQPGGQGRMNGPGGQGGMGGPGNEQQPSGEMQHHEQPGGQGGAGGMNGPTGGPGNENQPQGEMHHHEQPGGQGGMNGPGGQGGTGPGNEQQPQGEMRHHEQQPGGPGGQGGGMNGPAGGPGNEQQPQGEMRHHEQPGGQGGTGGPGNEQQPQGETRHHEQPGSPGGQGGTNGPGAAGPGGGGQGGTAGPQGQGQQNPPNEKKKNEKKPPPEQPPGNPQ